MGDLGIPLQKFEMIQHRMIGRKIQLAVHANGVMPGLHARELDAFARMKQFAAGETFQKIEMPPGAAEFAIGRDLQAGRGLPVHDLLDLHILGLAQIGSRDLALLEFGARILDALRPQQAADLVGTKGRFSSLHGVSLPKICRHS